MVVKVGFCPQMTIFSADKLDSAYCLHISSSQ